MQSRFFLGEVGNGAAMKLVVNMIMGRLKFSLVKHQTKLDKTSLNRYFHTPTLIILYGCSLMASFSEGLQLSEKVGLEPNVIIVVVYKLLFPRSFFFRFFPFSSLTL